MNRLQSLCALLLGILLLGQMPARAQTGSAACPEPAGRVIQATYPSRIIGGVMRYAAYLPPCFTSPDRAGWRYPAVYLMHGSDATGTDYWLKLGLAASMDAGIRAGTLPPMIVILPFGGEIANINRFDERSWAAVFTDELIPAVEAAYPIDSRRESRAVGGISRGGFWAFHLAFLRPDLFSIVGGHSPFFSLEHLRTANPLFLAQSAQGLETLRIWLDHGQYDYAGPNVNLMHRRLDARNIIHTYMPYAGGRHDGAYWASHMADYLFFYGQTWFALNPPPTPTPSPTPSARDLPIRARAVPEVRLYVPAAAYRSHLVSLESGRVWAVRRGGSDPKLVIDSETLAQLAANGVTLHPDTRIVPPDGLIAALERDRTAWTIRAWEAFPPSLRVLAVDETHPVDYVLDGDAESYPLAVPGLPNFDPARLTRITFSGVTAPVRDTADAIDANGVIWATSGLRGATRRADFFHLSHETSFYETCPQFIGGRPPGEFCAKPAYFSLFRELGADIIELSGNHNNDYGPEAYLQTLALYRQTGLLTVGGGENVNAARRPLSLAHHGNRIALISCNYAGPTRALATESGPGAALCDPAWLAAELPRLKASHEVVIATVQYWEFDQFTPSPAQRRDFRQLADWGADVVIGTQAHVPQTFEFYGEKYLHFGLGNVYFDQTYFQMRFFMPTVYIYAGRVHSIGLFVGIIDEFGRPRPMDTHNRAHFLGTLFAR